MDNIKLSERKDPWDRLEESCMMDLRTRWAEREKCHAYIREAHHLKKVRKVLSFCLMASIPMSIGVFWSSTSLVMSLPKEVSLFIFLAAVGVPIGLGFGWVSSLSSLWNAMSAIHIERIRLHSIDVERYAILKRECASADALSVVKKVSEYFGKTNIDSGMYEVIMNELGTRAKESIEESLKNEKSTLKF